MGGALGVLRRPFGHSGSSNDRDLYLSSGGRCVATDAPRALSSSDSASASASGAGAPGTAAQAHLPSPCTATEKRRGFASPKNGGVGRAKSQVVRKKNPTFISPHGPTRKAFSSRLVARRRSLSEPTLDMKGGDEGGGQKERVRSGSGSGQWYDVTETCVSTGDDRKQINQYKIEGLLGHGASGSVLKAVDTKTGDLRESRQRGGPCYRGSTRCLIRPCRGRFLGRCTAKVRFPAVNMERGWKEGGGGGGGEM